MKKLFQNGFGLFLFVILLFALIPFNALANESISIPEEMITNDELVVDNFEANNLKDITFSSEYQDWFKVNSLTAERAEDKIIFTFNYESTKNGGYSFFNPPNGDAIMKRVHNGIKTGTHTTTLELSLYDLKKVLQNDSITMIFYSSFPQTSFINFKTAQLSSLVSQDELDNLPEKIVPSTITLDKTNLDLTVGHSDKLTPSFSPIDTTETTLTWTSSNTAIVKVDSNGNIEALQEGSATITATTINNLSVNCQVKVTAINGGILYRSHIEVIGWMNWAKQGEISGVIEQSLDLHAIQIMLDKYENLGISYQSYIKNTGWESETGNGWKNNGAISGTEGSSNPLEAIQIKLTGQDVNQYNLYYQVYAENIGWMGWAKNGESAGTLGYDYSLRGIRIQILPKGAPAPGPTTKPFMEKTNQTIYPTNIYLDTPFSNFTIGSSEKITPSFQPVNATETAVSWHSSDPSIVKVDANGNITGVKKGTATITATTVNNLSANCKIDVKVTDRSISYQTLTENKGWGEYKYDGELSGLIGQSLHLEGIKVRLDNNENLGVTYQSYIQNIGWESETGSGWKHDSEVSGREDLSHPLEAIQIKLYDSNANQYDLYYQVHAQNVGWMDWAKNGERAGTVGYDYALEGIRIQIVPKGAPAPGPTTKPFMEEIVPSTYPTAIYLDKPSINFTVGSSEKLIPAFDPKNTIETAVIWHSSDPSIVKVDSNGNIVGVKGGKATITATTVNELTAISKIIVNPKNTNPSKLYVNFIGGFRDDFKINSLIAERVGDKIIFSLNYESFDNLDCIFVDLSEERDFLKKFPGSIKKGTNTSDLELTLAEFEELLTFSDMAMRFYAGRLTGGWVNFETVQLKPLLTGDIPDDTVFPTAISLNKTTSNLFINKNEKLSVTLSPFNVTEAIVTWTSSDKSIATVDLNGNIKGIKEGTATITTTTVNGLSASCQVKVKANTAKKSISYETHVQNVGWQELKYNGEMSGTSGQSLRLEGIKIKLNDYDNLGITYQTHIQNIGWEAETNRGWKSDGDMSGTSGLSYRLEAIEIKLTGADKDNYDIYYQVHAQNVGWMGWAKNGERSGTAGYGYRLEGIRIQILPKGSPAPSDNVTYANPFK